jgi:hypothetical protein
MKKRIVKFFCTILAGSILTTCQIPVTASSLKPSEDVLNSKSEELSTQAETLISQSVETIINNNTNLYNELDHELDDMGVKKISYEDVVQLTSVNGERLSDNALATYSNNNVTFRTQCLDYTKNGKTYDMMRIYATPTNAFSTLHKASSQVTRFKSTQTKVTASAVTGLNMAISTIGGAASDTISRFLSVYDLVKGIYSACSSTSTLNNVESNTTWDIMETCSFIYFKNKSEQMWHLKGRFSQASASVNVCIPTIKFNGISAQSRMDVNYYYGDALPKYYNRIEQPFNCFLNGGIYESRITNVVIFGIAGSSIHTDKLSNPSEPAEIY